MKPVKELRTSCVVWIDGEMIYGKTTLHQRKGSQTATIRWDVNTLDRWIQLSDDLLSGKWEHIDWNSEIAFMLSFIRRSNSIRKGDWKFNGSMRWGMLKVHASLADEALTEIHKWHSRRVGAALQDLAYCFKHGAVDKTAMELSQKNRFGLSNKK